MESIRKSSRQIKRKVHFAFDNVNESNSKKDTNEQYTPINEKHTPINKKKCVVLESIITPELDSKTFVANYTVTKLSRFDESNIDLSTIENHIKNLYYSYLDKTIGIPNDSVENLVLYLQSIYNIFQKEIYHFEQLDTFIKTCNNSGVCNIDFIIRCISNSYVEVSKFNIYRSNMYNFVNKNIYETRLANIQKDLMCALLVKNEFLKKYVDHNIINYHKIIITEILKLKLNQYVLIDMIIKAYNKFTNLSKKSFNQYNNLVSHELAYKIYQDLIVTILHIDK